MNPTQNIQNPDFSYKDSQLRQEFRFNTPKNTEQKENNINLQNSKIIYSAEKNERLGTPIRIGNKNIQLSGLKKDRPDGMIRQREDMDKTTNNTPAKVTTKTFREDNGDKIVTVTQRHATTCKPGRIVTTITTGIRSGNVRSETIEEEIQPLTHIEAASQMETSFLEDQGNEAFRQQVLSKINKQLFGNSHNF
jgi:hypothetical protein